MYPVSRLAQPAFAALATAAVPGHAEAVSENVPNTSASCGEEQGRTETSRPFGLSTQSPFLSLNTADSLYLIVTGLWKPCVRAPTVPTAPPTISHPAAASRAAIAMPRPRRPVRRIPARAATPKVTARG